jgi:RNA polymerase sigma-70 factor (ECF subfamily)
MNPGWVTTTALLDGLMDPSDTASWQSLDQRFRPILCNFAQKLGLDHEDAEDVAQEALLRFCKAFREGKYDRTRGRLSSWLVSITRNCVYEQANRRAARKEHRGESAILSLPGEDELERVWEAECRHVLLRKALEALRESTRLDSKTIRAFEMLAFEQATPQHVAECLQMSLDSVYAAKNRCLAQMRTILDRLNQCYEALPAGRLHSGLS